MGTGIYSIGVSGIAAAQLGLLATEHNVVNANTPGYSRQRAIQETNIAMGTGAGAIGQGVHVQTVERMYDRFLNAQVNTATTKLGSIDAYYTQIKQIDNLLADPSAGLTPALQDFFSGVQQVAANPSLLSARQSMVSSAQTLVSRLQSIELRLSELNAEVNGKIQDSVASINSYATQIAEVNQRIVIAQSSYGQPANDLLDQRDMLINDLNKLINVSTITNRDGSFSLFVGSGQQLVTGSQAMTMTALPSSADNERIVVGLKTVSNDIIEFPESLLGGGSLAGLTQFRSESLDVATNELGRVAATLAMTFNAQHALGQDLLGQANGETGFNADFFSLRAVGPLVQPNSVNQGNAVIEASLVNPPPTAGLYTLGSAFDPATQELTYSVTRESDDQVWEASISGTAAYSQLASDVLAADGVDISNPLPAGYTYTAGFDVVTESLVYSVTRAPGTLGGVDLGFVWSQSVPAQTALNSLSTQLSGEGLNVANAAALSSAMVTDIANGVASSNTVSLYGPTASAGNFYSNLGTSDYKLEYDGSRYSLIRLSDNVTWQDSDFAELSQRVANVEGFTLSNPSGAMQRGDSFLIQPTRNAARNLEVNELIANDPRLIAAAAPFRTSAAMNNSGSGTISAGEAMPGFQAGLFPASGITVSYVSGSPSNTISLANVAAGEKISVRWPDGKSSIYDATTTVTTPVPGTVDTPIPYVQGMEISVSGLSFTLGGLPNNGDTFQLTRNAAGVADGRNILALGQLQTQNTMSGGKATYQTSYAEMVARNGIKTRELGIMGESQSSVLEQAWAKRDALSGVNLDEEAANLLKYQQAYQAAAKILEIGKTVFDTILQLR